MIFWDQLYASNLLFSHLCQDLLFPTHILQCFHTHTHTHTRTHTPHLTDCSVSVLDVTPALSVPSGRIKACALSSPLAFCLKYSQPITPTSGSVSLCLLLMQRPALSQRNQLFTLSFSLSSIPRSLSPCLSSLLSCLFFSLSLSLSIYLALFSPASSSLSLSLPLYISSYLHPTLASQR